MRVALLVPGFSADERDWCIPALLNLVRSLARHAELEVFALRYPHRRATYSIGAATIHSLGWGQRRGAHSAALWAAAVNAIRQRHRACPFDVLHAVWADEPAWVAAALAGTLRLPLIVSLAGGELADVPSAQYGLQRVPLARMLIGWALSRAACVTAGSEYLQGLVQLRGCRAVRAPFGVDTALFKPAISISITGLNILNVGSLSPVKNQLSLVRAMRRVAASYPEARLHIAGEGPLRARLMREIARLNLRERVTLLGELPHDRLPALYQQSALCVQSSLHEAQGMAMLEAAACGVPLVGTSVGVLPELAARGAALLTTPGDEAALADALCTLLSDPARRQRMGDSARDAVCTEFELEHCADRFLRLYADVTM